LFLFAQALEGAKQVDVAFSLDEISDCEDDEFAILHSELLAYALSLPRAHRYAISNHLNRFGCETEVVIKLRLGGLRNCDCSVAMAERPAQSGSSAPCVTHGLMTVQGQYARPASKPCSDTTVNRCNEIVTVDDIHIESLEDTR
jgi:hypothetical protein